MCVVPAAAPHDSNDIMIVVKVKPKYKVINSTRSSVLFNKRNKNKPINLIRSRSNPE